MLSFLIESYEVNFVVLKQLRESRRRLLRRPGASVGLYSKVNWLGRDKLSLTPVPQKGQNSNNKALRSNHDSCYVAGNV